MKEKFNYSDDHFNKLIEFANKIFTEKEYYNFIFYLVIDLRLSIEDIIRIYDRSTFSDIKQDLEQKLNIEFKKCNSCGQTKSITSFSMKSKVTHYRSSFCKLCKAKKRKESLENDPIKNNNLLKIIIIIIVKIKIKFKNIIKNILRIIMIEYKNIGKKIMINEKNM